MQNEYNGMKSSSVITIHSQDSEISPSEWLALNHFLHGLKQINSSCISVYYPYGKGQETISLLRDTKRSLIVEKIETEIEKRIEQLRKNPSSIGKFAKTLCIFGWVENGKVKLKEIGLSKNLPYVYMLSKKPFIKPFDDILKTQHSVLLITLDQKSARLQRFNGNQLVDEASIRIDLHGRHKKGGQSQGRFLRARQTKIHVFYKKVASKVRKMGLSCELVLLGGIGQAKTEFFDELDSDMTRKCRFVEGLSFSTCLDDIYKKIIHHLYLHRTKHVEEIVYKYERLVKDGLTAKRNAVIYDALKIGAVDTLIVSMEYRSEPQFKNIMSMLEVAKNTSSTIEFVSSAKIIKKLEIDNSVLAILRYKIK